MMTTGSDSGRAPGFGLCEHCTHALIQESKKGSRFLRCGAAEEDERLPRYPRIPVLRCPAHREGAPD